MWQCQPGPFVGFLFAFFPSRCSYPSPPSLRSLQTGPHAAVVVAEPTHPPQRRPRQRRRGRPPLTHLCFSNLIPGWSLNHANWMSLAWMDGWIDGSARGWMQEARCRAGDERVRGRWTGQGGEGGVDEGGKGRVRGHLLLGWARGERGREGGGDKRRQDLQHTCAYMHMGLTG